MNWDAVGAVAELVGALAVVVTLAYLALQIRQNSSLARADLYQKAQSAFSSWRSMANAHPHILVKMNEPQSLSAEELIVANNIASELAFSYAMLYENQKIIAPDQIDSMVTGFTGFFLDFPEFYPTIKEQLLSNGFSEFVELLDNHRSQGGT